MSYYFCEICGNVVECKDELATTLSCCNQKMTKCHELKNDDEHGEKHVPTYSIDGRAVCIKIGETLHPSNESHYIVFIELTTDKGKYTRTLRPGDRPECCFYLGEDEKPLFIRSYCNIHGLWRRYFPD